MKSSLIPEKPILIYPSLAATLGLEESVLLSALSDMVSHITATPNNGYGWYALSVAQLTKPFPFWDRRDLHRITTNLREKGVILVATAPLQQSDTFKFAFNEKLAAQSAPTAKGRAIPVYSQASNEPSPTQGHFLSKNFISPNWQPEQDTLMQLAQHNIPAAFAYQQVPEFVTYWKERGEVQHSWGAKFISHTIRQWRAHQSEQHKKSTEIAMHAHWKPSVDAMEIMTQQAEIPRDFIEDAIPEFILYWQERGEKLKTWNSKFIQHVRLQWKKFHSTIESNTDPKPIVQNWQPSDDVLDVLRMANIDIQFALQLVPEFVIYWRDSNQLHTSWNTRFLQHAKRQWASRYMQAGQMAQPISQNRSTREISLEEQLNDRSWAN